MDNFYQDFFYPPVHVSGFVQHQRCRRKWFFGDRHWGLGYRPYPTSGSAAVGTLFHDALHLHYGEGFDWAAASTLAEQRWTARARLLGTWDMVDDQWWAETLGLFYPMIAGYGIHWDNAEGPLSDRGLAWVTTEQKFSFQLGNYTIEGIWDGIVRLNGRLWVFETKTTAQMERLANGLSWDYQPQVYVAAAQMLYSEPVGGVIYNLVKRTDPFNVKMLQNGMPSTSKAERLTTTPTVYQALVEQGLFCLPEDKRLKEEAKYMILIAEMKTWENPLYKRMAVTFTPEEIERILRYIELESNAMVATASIGAEVQPSFDRYTCGGCAYRYACQALNSGADWQDLLDATMTKEMEDLYGEEAFSTDSE